MGDVDRIRAHRVLARLRAVVTELSGYDPADLNEASTFLELGFDSLFLTQLATKFQREYGIRITFSQLFDELPTLRALADHIDGQLPSEMPTVTTSAPSTPTAVPASVSAPAGGALEPHPDPPGAPAVPMLADAWAGVVPAPWPVAGAAVAQAGVRGIMAQQLVLMSQQIQLLRSLRGAGPTAVSASPDILAGSMGGTPAIAPFRVAPTLTAVGTSAASPLTDATEEPPLPKGFGLSQGQRDHITRLTARYNARTIGSKRSAAANRRHHADPRTAACFNQLWKELVYPIAMDRSSGSTLQDVDGNQYIDLLNGFGSNFLGHNPRCVSEALKAQIDRGIGVGAQTSLEGEAAAAFCELTGMDRVSWVNTGAEAIQAAIGLSKAFTRRSRIVVFSGDGQDGFDEVPGCGTTRAANDRCTQPAAPGIHLCGVKDVLVLDYGADESLGFIQQHATEIAAVIVEPAQSHRPDFQPREFLHALRKLTEREGIILVFDEVVTGFRLCPGGAQEYYGIEADLATYGSIIGGGIPIGALAGRARIMNFLDGGQWQYGDESAPSTERTRFSGAFVRHPLAIAAAHATLHYLKAQGPALQEAVNRRTTRLAGELNRFFEERGVKIHIPSFGSQIFIRVQEEGELATLLFVHLRDRGIHVLEGFPHYMTAAHTDEDADRIVSAFKDSVLEMQADGILPQPALFESPTARALGREIERRVPLDSVEMCAEREVFRL